MTITVDAATENVRTLTTSPQTFSHAGAASGVKGVALAIVHGTSSTDHVSAASYGGVALTRIQRNTDTATEPGAAEWWFLGASVPQGTQTVSYTPGATTDDIHAVCITLLGDGDLRINDNDGVNNDVANPSVTLQYGGKSSMAFGALYGGGAAPSSFTPNGNCTTVHDHDLGAFYSEIIRQTTAGTADFAIGGTATSDDVAFAAIAVTEKQTLSSRSYSHVGTASKIRSVQAIKPYSHVGTAAELKTVNLGAKAYSHVGTLVTIKGLLFQVSKAFSHVASLVSSSDLVLAASRAYSHVASAVKRLTVGLGAKSYSHVGAATETKTVSPTAKAYSHTAALASTESLQIGVSKSYGHAAALVMARVLSAAKSLAYGAVHGLVTAYEFVAGGVAEFLNPWYGGKTIHILGNVNGLVEWVDYWPIRLVTGNSGRFNNDGAIPIVQVLGNVADRVAWVDYIPVHIDNSRTRPWSTDPDGFIPVDRITP